MTDSRASFIRQAALRIFAADLPSAIDRAHHNGKKFDTNSAAKNAVSRAVALADALAEAGVSE